MIVQICDPVCKKGLVAFLNCQVWLILTPYAFTDHINIAPALWENQISRWYPIQKSLINYRLPSTCNIRLLFADYEGHILLLWVWVLLSCPHVLSIKAKTHTHIERHMHTHTYIHTDSHPCHTHTTQVPVIHSRSHKTRPHQKEDHQIHNKQCNINTIQQWHNSSTYKESNIVRVHVHGTH